MRSTDLCLWCIKVENLFGSKWNEAAMGTGQFYWWETPGAQSGAPQRSQISKETTQEQWPWQALAMNTHVPLLWAPYPLSLTFTPSLEDAPAEAGKARNPRPPCGISVLRNTSDVLLLLLQTPGVTGCRAVRDGVCVCVQELKAAHWINKHWIWGRQVILPLFQKSTIF